MEVQKYMTSPIFTNNEVNLLHALRSRSTVCKVNYKQKYGSSNLLCSLCKIEDDDQLHILTCKVLSQNIKSVEITKYEDIFSSDIQKQKVITVLYQELFKIRDNLKSQLAPGNI